ncbi:hypothetical protein CLV30_11275 [Haloactinopolyspora alba]|uniref:Uncharacterized protein n=1 Tax=Haloactinopolyspora alba TaxID=648780 RepID=A0A2P8DX87_9ACTN|nr:DUF6113 family protein [Haloactinopolyspora alba]PSL01836.1 hypothetical protein CLV30_11275 [Haloactinopolyspora alba]
MTVAAGGARRRTGARVLPIVGVFLLAVVAAVVAVAGAFVHMWASPAGLVLAVGGAAGVAVLARACARTRAGGGVVAVAWLAPTLVLAQHSPGDDLVITGEPVGLVFLFGGSVSHAVALGLGAGRNSPRAVT